MTLKIGPLAVDPPVVLAPMAGVTDATFRRLCRGFGAGLYVSEMVSAHALAAGDVMTRRLVDVARDPVRSVQLYAVTPADAATACRILVEEFGADHVDLNFGCPTPKITRRGGGAALPARPQLFAAIVAAAVRAAGVVPVTVKMRRGLDAGRLTHVAAGRAAEDAGAAAVAVHARTAAQWYAGRADWAAIGELKAAVATVPVLGNGDVWSAADALRLMAATGCDGVVVGRGCLGRPWFFGELAAAFAGRPVPPPPTLRSVLAIAREHGALLVEALGDELSAVRRLRKHLGWYLTGYPVDDGVRRALRAVSSLAELAELSALATAAAGDARPADPALPRGPQQGPRRVALPDRWLDADPVPTIATGG